MLHYIFSYILIFLDSFLHSQSYNITHFTRQCDMDRPFLRYYKMKSCHKSTQSVTAWKNVPDVFTCMKFAREANGLAFNFSPPEAKNLSKSYVRNCQILGCPEIGAAPTLVKNDLFDYYSAYGNFNAIENSTCLRSVGVFSLIEEKLNYTEAIQYCQAMGSDLANVLTEQRTNALSKFIENEIAEWYKATYVGLDDIETEGEYETPLGSYLRCSKYRAWSPGHPRSKYKNEDCVILDANKMWKAINCKVKLPFICEFYPEAPLVLNSMTGMNCENITDKGDKKKCIHNKEIYHLMENSPRVDQCALLEDFSKNTNDDY